MDNNNGNITFSNEQFQQLVKSTTNQIFQELQNSNNLPKGPKHTNNQHYNKDYFKSFPSDKLKEYLEVGWRKYYNTTSTLYKYNAFYNLPASKPCPELLNITIKHTQKRSEEITINDINKAILKAINDCNTTITRTKDRIAQVKEELLSREQNLGSQGNPTIVDTIREKAYNSTIETKKACLNQIFNTFTTNFNTIHHERAELFYKKTPDTQLKEKYDQAYALAKQATAAYNNWITIKEHILNNTTPEYLNKNSLPWKGPNEHKSTEMDHLWQATQLQANQVYLNATLEMYDKQIDSIELKIAPLISQLPTQLFSCLTGLALSHTVRHYRTTRNVWTLDDKYSALYKSKLETPFEHKQYWNFFNDQDDIIRKTYNKYCNSNTSTIFKNSQPTPPSQPAVQQKSNSSIEIIKNFNKQPATTPSLPQRKRFANGGKVMPGKKPKMEIDLEVSP